VTLERAYDVYNNNMILQRANVVYSHCVSYFLAVCEWMLIWMNLW